MTKLPECKIDSNHLEGRGFSPTGTDGDWQEFSANFSFGEKYEKPPVVVATPILEDEFHAGAYPVCVIKDVTVTGFTLAARNMARTGFAAFNWVSILETPGTIQIVPGVDIGILTPLFFGANGAHSDQQKNENLNDLDHSSSGVIVTASDQNVSGHSIGAVVALRDIFNENTGQSAGLSAQNPDVVGGSCNFNWASFLNAGQTRLSAEPSIEAGIVSATFFQPGGISGDWNIWNIRFSQPFTNLPVLLLTANNFGMAPTDKLVAPVGVVQSVTTTGFRLAARNSDIASGRAGFNWIAIGL